MHFFGFQRVLLKYNAFQKHRVRQQVCLECAILERLRQQISTVLSFQIGPIL